MQDVYAPQTLNRYSYVQNNPLKYTDPTGHINEILNYNKALNQYYSKPSAQTYNNYVNTTKSIQNVAKSTASVQTTNNSYQPQKDVDKNKDVAKPVYNYLLGNDLKTINNPNATLGQKGLAGVSVLGYIAPPLKGAKTVKGAVEIIDDSRVFNPDQVALVELAKDAKRKGVSEEDAQTLVDWAKEYDLKYHDIISHPNREYGQFPHINIGPIKHIFIK